MASTITLNKLIDDLMLIIRGSEVVRTEPISKSQIEGWIHEYRSFLLKQDLDKGKLINPDYIQTLSPITLSPTGEGEFITDREIPNTVFRSSEDGFTWIGNTDGREYQYMTEERTQWNQYRRYTYADPYVYLKDNKLIDNIGDDLEIKGLFENPMEVLRFNGPDADMNSPYPLPIDLVPTIKEMILSKELKIEASSPNDKENNRVHNID